MGIENYYRIGSMSEKKILMKNKERFHGLAVSAHIVAHFYDSLKKYLFSLGKPFYIDPMTYVFARDLNNIKRNGKIRMSFHKYMSAFTESTQQLLEQREFLPKDFLTSANNIKESFVDDILTFQRDFIAGVNERDDPASKTISKYREILQKEETEQKEIKPQFLITPYFYFESTENPWYRISLELAEKAMEIETEYPIYPVICFTKELLLNEKETEKIITDYSKFPGINFWINNFNERKENIQYLRQLATFVENLKNNNKPMYNLYGDYYSLLLTKKGLTGYTRGVGMSEKRDVDASAKGGGNPERYYLPFLHTYASKTYAREFFSDRTDLLCTCEICREVKEFIPERRRRTSLAEEFFNNLNYMIDGKKHFLQIHQNERQRIEESSMEEIQEQLEKQISDTQQLKLNLYNLNNNHLRIWYKALFD